MIIEVHAYCRDTVSLYARGEKYEDNIFIQENSYMPSCSLGSGKYVTFNVDNETGQILDWKPIDITYLVEDN